MQGFRERERGPLLVGGPPHSPPARPVFSPWEIPKAVSPRSLYDDDDDVEEEDSVVSISGAIKTLAESGQKRQPETNFAGGSLASALLLGSAADFSPVLSPAELINSRISRSRLSLPARWIRWPSSHSSLSYASKTNPGRRAITALAGPNERWRLGGGRYRADSLPSPPPPPTRPPPPPPGYRLTTTRMGTTRDLWGRTPPCLCPEHSLYSSFSLYVYDARIV